MASEDLPVPKPDSEAGGRVAEAILGFLSRVPKTEEPGSDQPIDRARSLAAAAASKAAITAGSLALPPGPWGWLTILPELVAIWKIQAQMVADIGGAFGKQAFLTREQLLYCLFRHTAAQAVRDLVVRVGERYLVRRLSVRATREVAGRVGLRMTQRFLGRGLSRLLPVIGALGVAGYAYYDTNQVGRTAINLFRQEIEPEPETWPKEDL